MQEQVVFPPRYPLFSWKTIPFDLMAIAGLAAVYFLFIPDLQLFTRHSPTVTAPATSFSSLSLLGAFFLRLVLAAFSLGKGPNTNRIMGALSVVGLLVIAIPHLFRVPLLVGWAHHCGYDLSQVIHGDRNTQYVFQKTGGQGADRIG